MPPTGESVLNRPYGHASHRLGCDQGCTSVPDNENDWRSRETKKAGKNSQKRYVKPFLKSFDFSKVRLNRFFEEDVDFETFSKSDFVL